MGLNVPASGLYVALLAALCCAPVIYWGAPYGHSIEYNLIWSKAFFEHLAHGDLYPRWMMELNRGAGSPVFYFYAPLPFYLGVIPALLAPAAPALVQVGILEYLLIALSGIAFARCFGSGLNRLAVIIGATFYMLLPYHFEIDLWRRQDLGELANYIWMPVVFHYTARIVSGRSGIAGLAVAYALMVFSHLPSTLLFSICLLGYVLAQLSRQTMLNVMARFAVGVAIGLLLSAIYWVPALFTQKYVQIGYMWTGRFDYHRWLIPFTSPSGATAAQLIFGRRLLLGIVVSTCIYVACLISALASESANNRRPIVAFLPLVLLPCFLMSSWSAPIWETVPLLSKVQFPWRMASVLDLAAAFAVLQLAQSQLSGRNRIGAAALAACGAVLACNLITSDAASLLEPFLPSKIVAELDYFVQRGADAPEYQTKWNLSPVRPDEDISTSIEGRPEIVYATANGHLDITRWDTGSIELSAELQNPTSVSVRQYYYPGWLATLDDGTPLAIAAQRPDGLVEIAIPAGNHHVHLKRVLLVQECVGIALSCSGTLILVILFVLRGTRVRSVTPQFGPI